MEIPSGTRIDKYAVEALIGRGGAASVFRVRHEKLGTSYALKILDVPAPQLRDRLLAEGRVQAGLQHPNVLRVFDQVVWQGAPGLVMELVDGPTLQSLIAAQPIPAPARDALVTGIVRGVRAAHRHGLVHRDLKPGNILLARHDETLVPKIADFGLAKLLSDDGASMRTTRSGALLGTPAYMAPEQIRSAKDVDLRADVYALGVILYELATRRLPALGDDVITIYTAAAAQAYPRPREIVPDLSEAQEAAILGALDPDRDRRIPDCDVLLAAWRGQTLWAFEAPIPTLERTSPFDLATLRQAAGLAPSQLEARTPTTASLETPPPAPVAALSPSTPPTRTATAAMALGAGAFGLGTSLVVGLGVVAVLAIALVAMREPEPPLLVVAPMLPQPERREPVPEPIAVVVPEPPDEEPPAPVRAPVVTGRVEVTGDAEEVWFVRGGKRSGPGSLVEGTWDVEATFRGKPVRTPLRVTVVSGRTVTVHCVATFFTCKVR